MDAPVLSGRSCCFTGHRGLTGDALSELPGRLDRLIEDLFGEGFRLFYTGGALGFDTLAAEAVLRARARRPEIRLVVARPCANQDAGWRAADRRRYAEIVAAADSAPVLAPAYFPGCMQLRNRYMVDRCDLCVSYVVHSAGGAAQTAAYAASRGIPVLRLGK